MLSGIKEIDMMILSYVDILDESYFKEILDDRFFWKLRLKNKLGFESNNIDYKSITKYLDNDETLEVNCHNLLPIP